MKWHETEEILQKHGLTVFSSEEFRRGTGFSEVSVKHLLIRYVRKRLFLKLKARRGIYCLKGPPPPSLAPRQPASSAILCLFGDGARPLRNHSGIRLRRHVGDAQDHPEFRGDESVLSVSSHQERGLRRLSPDGGAGGDGSRRRAGKGDGRL